MNSPHAFLWCTNNVSRIHISIRSPVAYTLWYNLGASCLTAWWGPCRLHAVGLYLAICQFIQIIAAVDNVWRRQYWWYRCQDWHNSQDGRRLMIDVMIVCCVGDSPEQFTRYTRQMQINTWYSVGFVRFRRVWFEKNVVGVIWNRHGRWKMFPRKGCDLKKNVGVIGTL
jgi:hypothetical protein